MFDGAKIYCGKVRNFAQKVHGTTYFSQLNHPCKKRRDAKAAIEASLPGNYKFDDI